MHHIVPDVAAHLITAALLFCCKSIWETLRRRANDQVDGSGCSPGSRGVDQTLPPQVGAGTKLAVASRCKEVERTFSSPFRQKL